MRSNLCNFKNELPEKVFLKNIKLLKDQYDNVYENLLAERKHNIYLYVFIRVQSSENEHLHVKDCMEVAGSVLKR